MRVGYVQFAPEFGETDRNLEKVAALVYQDRADLWVLPELFNTGYQFAAEHEVRELAEPIPDGPTTRRLIALAQDFGCHIVAGLAELGNGQAYNSAVLVGPSRLVARYRKVHLFYQEKRWFTPGDLPFPVADIGLAKIGLLVCYDHLFPEAARALALDGAEVIAHPANLVMPGLAQLTMRVRAMENRVFTVTANRIGVEARTEETLRFTGGSQIVAPTGEVLLQASPDREEVGVADVDPARARDKHLTRLNDVFADRRPEFYRRLVAGGGMTTTFKMATFNANSVRSRMPAIRDWLARERPDVLCLQETKVQDPDFPHADFRELGYHVVFRGQKAHAGVALASLVEPTDVSYGLDDGGPPDEARLIRATVAGIPIVNTYVPQGQSVDSPMFRYKLEWLKRLRRYFERHFSPDAPLLWCGDFNVAPEEIDVHNPTRLVTHVDFHPQARAALAEVKGWGFVDVFRRHHEEPGQYTFWDYRVRDALDRNVGWRVDHIWATRPLAERSVQSWIDRDARRAEKPSDHTFLVAEFSR